jgi:hypothetical protein
VKKAQDLDALSSDAVNEDERGTSDDEFASAGDAALSAHQRVTHEQVSLMFDGFVDADGCCRIVRGDEIQLLKSIADR